MAIKELQNIKIVKPSLLFVCSRESCKNELNPYHDETFFCDDDDDWSNLTPAYMLALLQKNGWHTTEDGYPFCSPECESKLEIEMDDTARRIRADIREMMKAGTFEDKS